MLQRNVFKISYICLLQKCPVLDAVSHCEGKLMKQLYDQFQIDEVPDHVAS